MSRINDLEREMSNIEQEIAEKQKELRYKQKEYALLLGEKAIKESLAKLEQELKVHLEKYADIDEKIAALSVEFLSARNNKEKENISIELTKLYNTRSDEENTIASLKAAIADSENDLVVNSEFKRQHLLEVALEPTEEQNQPQ